MDDLIPCLVVEDCAFARAGDEVLMHERDAHEYQVLGVVMIQEGDEHGADH
jgi:hypothetical protein